MSEHHSQGASMTDGWTRFDYPGSETIWQRQCPDCDLGLLFAPVRNCPRCGGSGYLTTTDREASNVLWHTLHD